MGAPIPSLARLLKLSPAERRSVIEAIARELEAEIERLRAGPVRVGYGRSRHSRSYHLQSLYARRRQLTALARDAGCGECIRELDEVT